jgi:uncharacterized protein
VLAVLGLLHGIFLFVGDILFVYSIAGALLLLWRRGSPREYLLAAAALVAVGSGLSWLFWEPTTAPTGTPPSWTITENITLEQLLDDGEDHWTAFESKAYGDGPYRSTLVINIVAFLYWLLASSLASFNARVLAFFLVGAALMKLGFFTARGRRWHRAMATIGFGAGIPVSVAASQLGSPGGEFDARNAIAAVLDGVGSLGVVFGYLGLVPWLMDCSRVARWLRPIAAAGRMALTNYLLQSVIGDVLFRWYGFDQFRNWTHAELLATSVLIWSAQCIASVAWLRAFSMGPLETLWRRLTYPVTGR